MAPENRQRDAKHPERHDKPGKNPERSPQDDLELGPPGEDGSDESLPAGGFSVSESKNNVQEKPGSQQTG